MPVETLHCPMCGALASTDVARCGYCDARLATVACPSCFGMMFIGAKFCSHCGARGDRTETAAPVKQLCPRCQVDMEAALIGTSNLHECPRCAGIWADAASLEQICAEREKQSAILGMAPFPSEVIEVEKNIRYLPCPVCLKLMNRVNFAHCSHVIVDVCKAHGTWFDKEELRRTAEFIRSGGLEKARARELANIVEERRRLRTQQAEQNPGAAFLLDSPIEAEYRNSRSEVSTVGDIGDFLLSLLSH